MEKKNKKYRLKDRKKRILSQYLVTYLIVFMIPLIICSIYFFSVIRMVGNDDWNFKQKELEHAAEQVDTMFEEFENMGNTLAADSYVDSFKHRSENVWECPNTYRLNELRDSLPQILLMNQSVFNYFIFFDESNLVINDRDIYQWEDFYKLYLRSEECETFEQWKEQMLDGPMEYGIVPEKTYMHRNKEKIDLLYFSRPLIMADGVNYAGIWIMFKKDAIMNRMPSLDVGSIQYILDNNGNVIYYENGKNGTVDSSEILEKIKNVSGDTDAFSPVNIKLDGVKFQLMSSTSQKSGFTYCILYPVDVIKQRMISIIVIAFVIVFFSILAGIWLSYLMSKKTVVPINEILSEISIVMEKNETHNSVFDSLKTNFSYLVKKNSDLSASIEEQKPYLRSAFVTQLLLGDIYSEEIAKKRAEYAGFEYKNRKYVFLLFNFELKWEEMNRELMSSCILALKEALQKEMPESFHVELGNSQVVLLKSVSEKERKTFRKDMEEHVENVKSFMPSSISEHLFVYGSDEVDKLTELCEVYRKSSCMFQYEMDGTEDLIHWYVPKTGRIMAAPSGSVESKLVSLVFAGDQKGLHDELEMLMKQWVLSPETSMYMQQMLFGELQLILVRILEKIDLSDEEIRPFYDRLEENLGLPLISQIHITLNLYRDICKYVSLRKQILDSDGIMANVIAYIDMNYADCCLSLTQVAGMFSVSEPTLSIMFKNVQGVKFSSYVESTRISKAKELLDTTDLTVREIAEKVGYTSANSFCRAFRRVTGINTSEFRKK